MNLAHIFTDFQIMNVSERGTHFCSRSRSFKFTKIECKVPKLPLLWNFWEFQNLHGVNLQFHFEQMNVNDRGRGSRKI